MKAIVLSNPWRMHRFKKNVNESSFFIGTVQEVTLEHMRDAIFLISGSVLYLFFRIQLLVSACITLQTIYFEVESVRKWILGYSYKCSASNLGLHRNLMHYVITWHPLPCTSLWSFITRCNFLFTCCKKLTGNNDVLSAAESFVTVILRQYVIVTNGWVVRAGVSVTWNVMSWSGGHEFKSWLGQSRCV